MLIGPVLQEVLSGIRHEQQFNKLKEKLTAFHLLSIDETDYIEAAHLSNNCRKHGIQGSHTDFLISAMAIKHRIPVFTTDEDFCHYQKRTAVQLYADPEIFAC